MSEGHRTPAGKSVLDDLKLDSGDVVKAKLAIRIQRSVQEMGLTQRQAAGRLPISQSRLSLISRGKLEDISQEKLEECLQALGHDIEIHVGPRHDGLGALKVLERA